MNTTIVKKIKISPVESSNPNDEAEASSDFEEKDENSTIHYISWGAGILLSLFYMSLITLVPQHNVLTQPQYWYEMMLISALGWCSLLPAYNILVFHHLLGISFARNWKTYWVICTVLVIVLIAVCLIYYYIYSVLFNLFPPMPFISAIAAYSTNIATFFTYWFRYYRYFKDKSTI